MAIKTGSFFGMPSTEVRRIFLSAVTREFQRCREMLRNDLMGPDLPFLVTEQSDFAVGGGSLLEKLDRYIGDCAAVIHIVGAATGSFAGRDEVESFLQARPNFLSRYKSLRQDLKDLDQISYTQWEAYLALDHRISLYIYLPDESFTERPPQFSVTEEEELSQKRHLNRLLQCGLDRGNFPSSGRLGTEVLRSLARLLHSSDSEEDSDSARELESFALWRDQDENSDTSEKFIVAPIQFDLELPPRLIAGQSILPLFKITEPGRTSVEQVEVEFEIGTVRITGVCDHLGKGRTVTIIPKEHLDLQQQGTPQMQVTVGCKRSCIYERFVWRGVANIITSDRLAGTKITARTSQSSTKRLRLELQEETLSPRQGDLYIALQPVPGGHQRFEMGSKKSDRGHQPDELQHSVRFTNSWWMSRHPISQRQYMELMNDNPSKFDSQSEELPVESVTWAEAVEFCELLTQKEREADRLPLGFQYRLPTEAEWEFACREGEFESATVTSSPNKDDTKNRVAAHPICTFPLDGNRGANRYGLCDMTGNVYQWCIDGYAPYPSSLQTDPCHGKDAATKVIRGGSWHDPVPFRRPTARMKCPPETRSSRIGFRIVLARV